MCDPISKSELRERRRHLHTENKRWPDRMTPVPIEEWPTFKQGIPVVALWRSKYFVAQVFEERDRAKRISVNRTELDSSGDWKDGISWDDLMRIKHEVGFGLAWAVEIFPPSDRVVNVANIRHLFVVPDGPTFAWKREDSTCAMARSA